MSSNDISGWSTGILEVYDNWALEAPDHAILVEVGVWLGRSVIHLAKKIMEARRPILVYAVDTFDGGAAPTPDMRRAVEIAGGSLFDVFLKNCQGAGVEGTIVPLVMDSSKAAAHFADRSVWGVMLDADHSYAAVKRDISAWLPKVTGVLAGHDSDYPDVARAVHESLPQVTENYHIWSQRI